MRVRREPAVLRVVNLVGTHELRGQGWYVDPRKMVQNVLGLEKRQKGSATARRNHCRVIRCANQTKGGRLSISSVAYSKASI